MLFFQFFLKVFTSILVFVLSLFTFGVAWSQSPEGNYVCDQAYVLCTSAPCIPDPTDPKNKSICECVVQVGKSFGNTSCEARKPKTLPDGSKALISTYSFEQAPTMQIMTCSSGKPWSNCLDQSCIVDPVDTKRAICTCNIMREGKFVTYGGSCDKGSCGLVYWSGATVTSYEGASNFFAKKLGIRSLPMNYCPRK